MLTQLHKLYIVEQTCTKKHKTTASIATAQNQLDTNTVGTDFEVDETCIEEMDIIESQLHTERDREKARWILNLRDENKLTQYRKHTVKHRPFVFTVSG